VKNVKIDTGPVFVFNFSELTSKKMRSTSITSSQVFADRGQTQKVHVKIVKLSSLRRNVFLFRNSVSGFGCVLKRATEACRILLCMHIVGKAGLTASSRWPKLVLFIPH